MLKKGNSIGWLSIALLMSLLLAISLGGTAQAFEINQAWTRVSVTCGEALATGDLAALKDADGYAYEADADVATLRPALGIVGKGCSSGGTAEVVTSGLASGWTGLAEGQPGYLSATASLVTQTPPTWKQPVGLAVSATGYLFNFSGGSSGAPAGATTSAADALAIPVTHGYVAKTTGADAEALTLANGAVGQVLTISLVVDGVGDGTLTPATASGWATIVFADAGDTATLLYVDDTVGWVLMGVFGLTAQPVVTL